MQRKENQILAINLEKGLRVEDLDPEVRVLQEIALEQVMIEVVERVLVMVLKTAASLRCSLGGDSGL